MAVLSLPAQCRGGIWLTLHYLYIFNWPGPFALFSSPKKEEHKKQEGQMSKDEDQVKKDENAFAELNKSNQANIDPCLALTAPEDDRNACVLV